VNSSLVFFLQLTLLSMEIHVLWWKGIYGRNVLWIHNLLLLTANYNTLYMLNVVLAANLKSNLFTNIHHCSISSCLIKSLISKSLIKCLVKSLVWDEVKWNFLLRNYLVHLLTPPWDFKQGNFWVSITKTNQLKALELDNAKNQSQWFLSMVIKNKLILNGVDGLS